MMRRSGVSLYLFLLTSIGSLSLITLSGVEVLTMVSVSLAVYEPGSTVVGAVLLDACLDA